MDGKFCLERPTYRNGPGLRQGLSSLGSTHVTQPKWCLTGVCCTSTIISGLACKAVYDTEECPQHQQTRFCDLRDAIGGYNIIMLNI